MFVPLCLLSFSASLRLCVFAFNSPSCHPAPCVPPFPPPSLFFAIFATFAVQIVSLSLPFVLSVLFPAILCVPAFVRRPVRRTAERAGCCATHLFGQT
jgi:hypothetical protein